MFGKCPCNNCSGHIEFDTAEAGSTVTCPHCGVDTALFVPQVPFPPQPKPRTAEIVEETAYDKAGVEGRLELTPGDEANRSRKLAAELENTGIAFFVIGIVAGSIALFVALYMALGDTTKLGIWFLVAVVAVAQGIVIRLLFNAGAEIIRLLAARLTGKIWQVTPRRTYKCSICKATVQPAQERCSDCGAEFSRESRLASRP